MSRLRLAVRLWWREALAGELLVLFAALVVAVAALASVALFADRVERALQTQATQLLAADLVVNGDHPADPALKAEADRRRLDTGLTATFPSMTFANGQAQLVTLKAVSGNWPLRGQARIRRADGSQKEARQAPAAGEAWADARLFAKLKLKPGDTLKIGDATFRLAATLEREPDGALDLYNFVPRVLIHADDLPATHLVQEGSRVRWRLLVAGPADTVTAYRDWVTPRLGRGQKLEDVRDARPEVRVALERAGRFLGLSALLAVFLAAAAVSLACRRWLGRHWQTAATLRTLGATQAELLTLFIVQLALVALLAGSLGLLVGGGVQEGLAARLSSLTGDALPAAGWLPWLVAPLVGATLLFGFALPPLVELRRVPALRVLRAEMTPTRTGRMAWLAGLAALAGLAWFVARDLKLAAWVLGGFAVFVLLTGGIARGLLALARRLPTGGRIGWRYGVVNLARRPWLAVAQTVALAAGVMALLTLSVVRGDLLEAWQKNLPPDAPNHFVINIQPPQRAPLAAAFAAQGLATPQFAPMVRGRLTFINDRAVRPETYEDERAQRLAEREFNLSWTDTLPVGNKLNRGEFWRAADRRPQWSVEKGIAEMLGIKLGDKLSYDIAGETFVAEVTSLREVSWDSFRVNFFVLGSPALLQHQPASYISSFNLPAGREDALTAISRDFPNLTIVDVTAILNEVRGLTDKLARAVEFMFGFSLAAGLLTLVAATLATQGERARDAALLRTLGASRRQLFAVTLAEFVWLGLIAGVLAAIGASALGLVLGRAVLDLPMAFNPALFGWGIAVALAATLIAGLPATQRILAMPPARMLRQLEG